MDQTDNQMTQSSPQADATLAQDTGAPPVGDVSVLAAPHDDAASAPVAQDDNAAGDYIMTEPHQPAPASDNGPAQHDDMFSMDAAAGDDLLGLKQQALQQLTPLVGHLDQTPEEKFRTTMMMIQAADNQALLKDAYEAANAIPDEKAKAQALLDVVNEINYFTQQHEPTA